MIIVEGADNVGKSTLVQRMLEIDPQLHEIKRRRFKPERNETIGTSYIQCLLPESGDRVHWGNGVIDRLLASEYIYGRLFRGVERVKPEERLAVQLLLMSYGALVVFCDPPDATIMEGWSDREQLYDDPLTIAHAYRERIRDIFSPLPIVRYNWAQDGTDKIETILDVHRRIQQRLHRELGWWSVNPHGAGRLDPVTLFISESNSSKAVTSVPFSYGRASNFFAGVVDQVPTSLGNMYVTNATKGTERDASLLREEISFLSKTATSVVTLGKVATEMYQSLEESLRKPLAHHQLPHPGFWRRFRQGRRDEYIHMIEEACS